MKLFPFRIDPTSKECDFAFNSAIKFSQLRKFSAFILRELKNWAEAILAKVVDRAVIDRACIFQ